MTEREMTYEEASTWGKCPVCNAEHGRRCDVSIGLSLGQTVFGQTVSGNPPKDGVHIGRLQAVPCRVRIIGVETLNGIKGRPEWLGEWESGVVCGGMLFGCARADGTRFSVFANEQEVFVGDDGMLRADQALELALYAKRVQIVLDRLNGPEESRDTPQCIDVGHTHVLVDPDGSWRAPLVPAPVLTREEWRALERRVRAEKEGKYMVGADEEAVVWDSLDDALSDALTRLPSPEAGQILALGQIIALEVFRAERVPVSDAVRLDDIISSATEAYNSDCGDEGDAFVSAKDGARIALEKWADTYLEASRPKYDAGERIVRHIVATVGSGGGVSLNVVEDVVAKALAADKTPRTIAIGSVRIAVNADGSWQEVKTPITWSEIMRTAAEARELVKSWPAWKQELKP